MNPQDGKLFLVSVFFEDEDCIHFVGHDSVDRRDSDLVNIAIQLGLKSSPEKATEDERIKSLEFTKISPEQFKTLCGVQIPCNAVGGLKLWRVNTAKFVNATNLRKQDVRRRKSRARSRRAAERARD